MSSLNYKQSSPLSPREQNLPQSQRVLCGSAKGQNFPCLKFKTERCKYWVGGGGCPFGKKCKFAHGQGQQRSKQFLPTKYKTRACVTFHEEGHCSYGLRCKFIHDNHNAKLSFQSKLECLTQEPQMFFSFLKETQNNNATLPRLNIFKQLCQTDKEEATTIGVSSTDSAIQEQSFIFDQQLIRSRQGSF